MNMYSFTYIICSSYIYSLCQIYHTYHLKMFWVWTCVCLPQTMALLWGAWSLRNLIWLHSTPQHWFFAKYHPFSRNNKKNMTTHTSSKLCDFLNLHSPAAQQWAVCIPPVSRQDRILHSWLKFSFIRPNLPNYFHIHLETFPSSPEWRPQKPNSIEEMRKEKTEAMSIYMQN